MASGIGRAFLILRRTYPDHVQRYLGEQRIMDEQMSHYQMLLHDIPDDVLVAATLDHCTNSQWWPKPSELRARAGALTQDTQDRLAAEEAWGVVTDYMRATKWRRERDGLIITPLMERAVKAIGGWEVFAESDGSAAANRARFIDAYRVVQKRKEEDRLMLPEVRTVRQAIEAAQAVKQIGGGKR